MNGSLASWPVVARASQPALVHDELRIHVVLTLVAVVIVAAMVAIFTEVREG